MKKEGTVRIPAGGLTVSESLEFVNLNRLIDGDVYFDNGNNVFNAKSVLGVQSLFFSSRIGEEFKVTVTGASADSAIEQIQAFFENTIINRLTRKEPCTAEKRLAD